MTDQEILKLYREGGREEAFRLLVQTYKERLYWHIRRMVLDHDDTDDCLQNTFLKAWRSLANFRGDAQLYTWLYRIATNETLTFLARQQTRGEYAGLDAADRLPTDPWFDGDEVQTALHKAIPSCLPSRRPSSTSAISRKCLMKRSRTCLKPQKAPSRLPITMRMRR